MENKKYMEILKDKYLLINKSIDKKIKNMEQLTDLELLYYIHFTEVAPVIAKYLVNDDNKKAD